MDIVILGAGEVGKQLASTLSESHNKIKVVDSSPELIERLGERLDVMTFLGNCANFELLKRAGIAKTDLLIATTGSDASNILACQIARHFRVKKTICRLSTNGFFSVEDGFLPASAGIDHLIYPQDECVNRIINVLEHDCVVEKLSFRESGALMTAIRIPPSSPLSGSRVHDFPDKDLLSKIRFACLVRNQKMLTPHGETTFAPYDEVYVAGDAKSIDQLIDLADPESAPLSSVLVAGATRIGVNLTAKLIERGFKVRAVERDMNTCESLIDSVGHRVIVINGDPTEADVLEEAGVSGCDAFISALSDDEENILSCVLAKRLGAKKVITVTNKAEYMDIVPSMKAIDCGFSPRLVAVNSVLSLLGNEAARVHAIPQRMDAYIYELDVSPNSRIANKRISEFERRLPVILAMVFRNGQMIPPNGSVELLPGDRVAAITNSRGLKALEPMFRKRGFLNG